MLVALAFLLIGTNHRTSVDSDRTQLAKLGIYVQLSENEFGVPSIHGESMRDVYFATGYLHAKDRLTQLVLQRARAKGRLAELLGRGHIQSDLWMHSLGLEQSVKRDYGYLGEEALKALHAYSAGINAWVSENGVPAELSLLLDSFENWTPTDSLLTQKLFSLNLSVNYISEMEHLLLQSVHSDPFDRVSDKLVPQEQMDLYADLFNALSQLSEATGLGHYGVGSNAWVVSGKHTSSGNPILANDPHLSMTLPSLWYAVEQSSQDFSIKGMSIVGLPIVIFGQNGSIAWGGTNMLADTQDLVLEETNPDNPLQYRTSYGWKDFQTSDVTLRVRADFPASLNKPIKPIKAKIRKTDNGPIISDIIGIFDAPVALRWSSLQEIDLSFEALYGVNHAKNWAEFRNALKNYTAPALNFLFADVHGNIGYQSAGAIPIRYDEGKGLPVTSLYFSQLWQGYIPFNQLPSAFNPEKGYIVSANNKVESAFGHHLSDDWADPARANRITHLLDARIEHGHKVDVNYFHAMQLDTVDLNGHRFAKLIGQLSEEKELSESLKADLISWQGNMADDSVAPILYVSWLRNVKLAIFSDELMRYQDNTGVLRNYIERMSAKDVYQLLDNDKLGFCNNISTKRIESCHEMILQGLQMAQEELSRLNGKDHVEWRWLQLNTKLIPHISFQHISFAKEFYNRTGQAVGTYDTINVAGYRYDEYDGYISSFGSSFRQIFEVSEHSSWFFSLAGGQSGNPLVHYYDDLYKLHEKGELIQYETNSTIAR
jgi:penicillin amidase